jgi:hypothetical protein
MLEGDCVMTDYKIIRYDPMLSEDPYQTEAYATMGEDKWGGYVKQEDYEILEKKITELEKEKEILRVVCEKADGIACNCTITDSQAVERLLALFEKNRDFYIPFKPREPTQAAYDELFNDKDK